MTHYTDIVGLPLTMVRRFQHEVDSGACLEGKKFYVTNYQSRPAIVSLIHSHSGQVTRSIDGSTDYIVSGRDSDPIVPVALVRWNTTVIDHVGLAVLVKPLKISHPNNTQATTNMAPRGTSTVPSRGERGSRAAASSTSAVPSRGRRERGGRAGRGSRAAAASSTSAGPNIPALIDEELKAKYPIFALTDEELRAKYSNVTPDQVRQFVRNSDAHRPSTMQAAASADNNGSGSQATSYFQRGAAVGADNNDSSSKFTSSVPLGAAATTVGVDTSSGVAISTEEPPLDEAQRLILTNEMRASYPQFQESALQRLVNKFWEKHHKESLDQLLQRIRNGPKRLKAMQTAADADAGSSASIEATTPKNHGASTSTAKPLMNEAQVQALANIAQTLRTKFPRVKVTTIQRYVNKIQAEHADASPDQLMGIITDAPVDLSNAMQAAARGENAAADRVAVQGETTGAREGHVSKGKGKAKATADDQASSEDEEDAVVVASKRKGKGKVTFREPTPSEDEEDAVVGAQEDTVGAAEVDDDNKSVRSSGEEESDSDESESEEESDSDEKGSDAKEKYVEGMEAAPVVENEDDAKPKKPSRKRKLSKKKRLAREKKVKKVRDDKAIFDAVSAAIQTNQVPIQMIRALLKKMFFKRTNAIIGCAAAFDVMAQSGLLDAADIKPFLAQFSDGHLDCKKVIDEVMESHERTEENWEKANAVVEKADDAREKAEKKAKADFKHKNDLRVSQGLPKLKMPKFEVEGRPMNLPIEELFARYGDLLISPDMKGNMCVLTAKEMKEEMEKIKVQFSHEELRAYTKHGEEGFYDIADSATEVYMRRQESGEGPSSTRN